jgi:hypothetical protein
MIDIFRTFLLTNLEPLIKYNTITILSSALWVNWPFERQHVKAA